jgi:hypothetical protein
MSRTLGIFALIGAIALYLFTGMARAEESIRIGFLFGNTLELQNLSRAEARASMELWAAELGKTMQVPVRITFYEDIEPMRADFRQMKINMVASDALSLAKAFNVEELADGFVSAVQGGWNLRMLAGTDSTIRKFSDLEGKRVAIVQKDPIVALVLDTLCLKKFGHECGNVFSEVIKAPSNNQAIMRVYFDQADAVFTYSYAHDLASEMNPQIGKKVSQVVLEYPLPGWFYAFYSGKTNPEFRIYTRRFVPILHTLPRGRQILDLFKMDHLEVVPAQVLRPYVDLYKDYENLKRNKRK